MKKYYHWIVMASCCLMASASIGLFTNAYGVFYTSLSESLNVGRGAVAMHATIAGLITGFMGPVVVRILQKVKLRVVIGAGALILAVSTVFTAYVEYVWQLNLLGVFRGIGCACYYVPVITIILGNWFSKYYGTVSGVTLSFSGIAGAVLSPCFSGLISRYGYRNTLIWAAVIILLLSLPGILFCYLHPEEIGMHAFGASEGKDKTDKSKGDERVANQRTESKSVMKTPTFYIICGVGFLSLFIIGLTQHMTGYSENIGMGTATGVAMMSAVMVGNITTKLLIGVVSDILGSIRASAIFMALAVGALTVMILHPENIVILMAAAFFIGGIYAVGAVGLAGVSKEMFGKEKYGEVFAVVTVVTCLSSSVALTVIGYTYDITKGYTLALGGAMLFGILSVLGLLVLYIWNRKKA